METGENLIKIASTLQFESNHIYIRIQMIDLTLFEFLKWLDLNWRVDARFQFFFGRISEPTVESELTTSSNLEGNSLSPILGEVAPFEISAEKPLKFSADYFFSAGGNRT